MKKIVCEMCGSSDLVKKEGVFVCQSCGVKYSVEEAKQMMVEVAGVVEVTGEVKIDNEARVKNILVNIERAFSDGKYEQVQTFCMQVLEEDADNVHAILYEGLALGWQGNTVRYYMNHATTAVNRAVKLASSQKMQNFDEFVYKSVAEVHLLASALIRLCSQNINDTSREAVKRINTLTKRINDLPYGYTGAVDVLVEQGHYERETSEKQIDQYDSVIERTVSDVMSVFTEVASYFYEMQWDTVNGIAVKLKEYTKIRNTALVKATWGLYSVYLEGNMPVETRYQNAINLMKSATTIEDFSQASSEFEKISEYEDAQSRSTKCQEKIVELQNNSVYEEARKHMKSDRIPFYESAIEVFEGIRDWKDSEKQIEICKQRINDLKELQIEKEKQVEIERREAEKRTKRNKKILIHATHVACAIIVFVIVVNAVIIPNHKYNDAVVLMENEKYQEAILAFEDIVGYKDSKTKILYCKYNNAIALMDSDVVEAYETLIALEGYKDSAEKANSIYEKYKDEKLKVANVGDYVYFGVYEQDFDTTNGKEEIEWLLLDRQDNCVLLLSKYVLDIRQYHSLYPYEKATWEGSELRAWLNDDFLASAFSQEEKDLLSTNIETNDKIFLLSVDEVEDYLGSTSLRECEATTYATSKDSWFVVEDNGQCDWVLRTVGENSEKNAYVTAWGGIDKEGHNQMAWKGIRPAMWVALDKFDLQKE